jgi:hypothetical protein
MTVRYLLLTITALLLLVGIVSAQDLAASPPNTIRHIITPEDVLTIRELYDVKLSPDGKQIAFEVSEPNQPREPRASNIWVVPTDGREPPRPLIPGLIPSPFFPTVVMRKRLPIVAGRSICGVRARRRL